MADTKSVFDILNNIDVTKKIKQKGNLKYLPWASAWAEIKKKYPDAKFKVHESIIYAAGADGNIETKNTKPWFDDGKTAWVKVSVTINDEEITEMLPIMNFKNQSLPIENITSADVNKSIKRCFVKALALHGLGLFIFEGEDLPDELNRLIELQDACLDLARKKGSLSDKAKSEAIEFCKTAEREANPDFADDEIQGNVKNVNNEEILNTLKRKLMTIRK